MVNSTTLRRAFITTELVVSIVLMALIATVAYKSMLEYARTRNTYSTRQAALWAAAAQLQRYQAGAAIDSQPPVGLIPADIKLSTEREPGQGQWQDFNRVTVTASATDHGRIVREQISAYVKAEGAP